MPVIALDARRKFIERKRIDYTKWKTFSRAKLRELYDRLPITPPRFTSLQKHQQACFIIGTRERTFGFFLDTGMGKSYLTMALYLYWRRHQRVFEPKATKRRRWLILVPNKSNKTGWLEQIKEHGKGINLLRLTGSSAEKWEQLQDIGEVDFVVETYAGLMHMVSGMVKDTRRAAKKKKDKQRMKWSASKIDQLCDNFDGLIMDESIKVMNKSALPHRICYQIRKRLGDDGFCYELNGTPFGRDPVQMWGQIFLLDLGRSLGETLGLFRSIFFKEETGRFGETIYKFDKTKERLLHQFIGAKTIAYEADEGDLPAVVSITKRIYLSTDAETYAKRAQVEVSRAKGNYLETKNAFLRMRQISSGWLGFKDDETGERASFDFNPNVKLEFLLDYIDAINPKYKLIVFHEFNYSGQLIVNGLKQLGLGHAWCYGKSKDPEGEIERWKKDRKCRVLVLSNSAGAYGHNLQAAKYGIYFEAPVSPIVRYQTRKRFERQFGPHKSVFRVDLVVPGTYDDAILAFHAEGKDLFDAIIHGRFKPLKNLGKAGSDK